jgi:hypothetical protein
MLPSAAPVGLDVNKIQMIMIKNKDCPTSLASINPV